MSFADATRRSRSAGANAEDTLFVKGGCPVAFFFHPSVREGRDVLEHEITTHGGSVCEDERRANVILVDEEADIEHIRRRYYRSDVLWQKRVHIEYRDFVLKCIRDRKYEHRPPARKGMPGAPVGRVRVPFTAEDDDHLAFYIATAYPNPANGGRSGNLVYQQLTEQLADEPEFIYWAKRHTWQSWRERYRMNRVRFDPMIAEYAAQLKSVGHGFGHDPRSRLYRREEEEEEESDEEVEQHAEGGAGPDNLANRVCSSVPQVSRNQVQDSDMPDHEPGLAQPQLRRRRRDDSDTSQRASSREESPQKRQRVASPATPSGPRTSVMEKGRRGDGHGGPGRMSNENNGLSPEERHHEPLARGALDGAISFDNNQMPEFDALPVPRSPEHGVPATQSDEPLTTQQTLVNSPTDIRSRQVPSARVTTVVQTASTSSQAISIAQPLRAARRPPSHRGRVQREQKPAAGTEIHSRIKRTSSKSRSNQPAVTASDAPYRHTRARSQSIDLPSQPAPASKRQRVVSAKGKGKMKEPELEEVLEDDSERNASQGPHTPNRCLEADTFQEQQDVEDHLLKGGSSLIDSEQSDSEASHEQQEFTVDSSSEDPSDSDDAATHENLERSGQRLTRMAAAGFRSRLPNTSVLLASNKARVTTRSSAIRITRHAAQAPPFPSPGTTKTIKRRGN